MGGGEGGGKLPTKKVWERKIPKPYFCFCVFPGLEAKLELAIGLGARARGWGRSVSVNAWADACVAEQRVLE